MRNLLIFAAGAFLAVPAVAVSATRPCPPDVDCSGAVDIDDLVAVVLDFGQRGTPTDVDGSGSVTIDDVVGVVLAWGDCRFDFGPPRDDAEAEQISLEMMGPSGPLLPSDAIYERIDRDLDLIRAARPELADQTHTLAWSPSSLIVGVTQGAPQEGYPCHNAYYSVIDENLLFSFGGVDYFVLTLDGRLNVAALSTQYAALDEVSSAEPDGIVGGQNFWVPTRLPSGNWQWDIDDGWLDCFDGCDCHRAYVIETDDAGAVDVISVVEFGQPWCEFGAE